MRMIRQEMAELYQKMSSFQPILLICPLRFF